MKKLIFSCILIFFGLGSHAQNAPANKANVKIRTPEQRAEHLTNWMNKKLTLSADQKAKIYDVNLKYAKMNQEVRANDADDRKAMHQELKANESEREGEFKTILSSDQFQLFQTSKQELKQKRVERRRRN